MSIQFIDMRISLDSSQDTPGVEITSSSQPYVFGDIGLQTASVLPANAGSVRVTLNAYARLQMGITAAPTLVPNATFTIFRNGNPIFTTTYQKAVSQTEISYEMAAITAVDFPTASEVLYGLIHYTISVITNYNVTIGARSFSGIAAAGSSF
ncbi:hypothetical protein P4H66_04045 [Paenibacillus dokdonensis]|uniref:Uncharacterized protein n=2 Tax=Paenibacillus dokdonensis TaxID=2567944 RepID=A0ABU6GH34_9BACL|nr:hypothetical protein [Paenibacillus dokdonensis]MEC0239042.1 hypothetical protein [Paenibacillus dokdonensis]